MQKLFTLDNIFYDDASIYPDFNVLNERQYLKNLFYELKKLLNNFEEFEFIIFCGDGSTTPVSKEKYNSNKKRILLYLSDESGYFPKELMDNYQLIFKSYLNNSHQNSRIYPFPIGYAADVERLPYIKASQRKYSCFYSGNLNPNREKFWMYFFNPIEKRILNVLLFHFKLLNKYTKALILRLQHFRNFDTWYPNSVIRFNSEFGGGFSKKEYSMFLQQSRFVVCPKGFISSECYRHYEGLRAGCILISEALPKNFFYKDSPIIEIEDWNSLKKVLSDLDASPEEVDILSKKSIEWYDNHMSEKAVAEYMMHIIQSVNQ